MGDSDRGILFSFYKADFVGNSGDINIVQIVIRDSVSDIQINFMIHKL